MQINEFSMQITARNTEEKITYEKCSVFCAHRIEILQKVNELGGTVGPNTSYVSVPTSKQLHELVRYIEKLIEEDKYF